MRINRSFEKTITSSKAERWRYPRFFTDNIDASSEKAYIVGDDAAHISKVLRMKPGDIAVICDGKSTDHLCRVVFTDKHSVEFRIEETQPCDAEPSVYLRMFQSVPKSNKLDFIIQKAVELGASEIIPVLSKRCVSRPDDEASEKKRLRLSKIAEEAAKQCGRGILPAVGKTLSFSEALAARKDGLGIFFYECGGSSLSEIISNTKNTNNIDVFIGPEGGYEEEEAEAAAKSGLITASLGKRILRCETAPVAALSILMNLTGNM